MPVPIRVPELGTDQCRFSLWHVMLGEHVHEGDRIVEILIPGACVDLPAPVSGVLSARLVAGNDPLQIGQILGQIEPDPD
jgi:pyruvate/2-oxoglutarate dehydrogenase complex dihydrolipoamide acyltransferase (E2) component